MAKRRIYLDYSASTPVDPSVIKAMAPYFKTEYGNPSSLHSFGQLAAAAMEKARMSVAQFLHAEPDEIIFTSGATEANNMILRGIVQYWQEKGIVPHIIASAIEHESILAACEDLEKKGLAKITYAPVDEHGIIQVETIEKAIQENTVLVTIMYGNSVIGTIQPISEIGQKIREINKERTADKKIIFHTDAVQAIQYLDCNVQELRADALTLSAHKIYGPKGIGALYIRKGIGLSPILVGGGQEEGKRAGTQNVPGIVGLGEAVRLLADPRTKLTNIKIRQNRDKLIKGILKKIPNSHLNGSLELRLASNVHVRFDGIEGRDVVMMLDQKGIAVSTGSACSERNQEPSEVLKAIGLSDVDASGGVRITLGKYTKQEEIEYLLHVLPPIVAKLQTTVS